ncbi:hypothetical protein [Bradyrhizobium sp.]|uniref:hypothetical protein n=1 Tax=Bradyrhizobium sp. TaxID=376 RepID=UPI0025C077DB|nr:hypothetical protein [Bradyrhizobium sp.]
MASHVTALLVAACLAAMSLCCAAEETDSSVDFALTPEQWQQRLELARRRSEAFVASARARATTIAEPDQKDAEATERAMKDPTLQSGDVIATKKGFLVFIGRDEERRPDQFRSIPPPP